MTPAGETLAAEIRAAGPISFRRFMQVALYHPEHGYYRRPHDPFGKGGDFYTAEQLQPVFGILMAQRIRQLFREMGEPAEFQVVELGAGRGEMAEAITDWPYVPVEVGAGALPEHFTGVVFSNEFFDALPVEVAVWESGTLREQRVGFRDGTFHWETCGAAREELVEYVRRYFPQPEEGTWFEVNLEALAWLERIAASLENGFVLSIDYGITRREAVRFPKGTLMSYHRHTARENVLENPGEQDITAHAHFTALQEHGAAVGLKFLGLETLARTILAAGEADQFAGALANGGDAAEEQRRRMQLKSLLFGMGETFRVLLQRKNEEGRK